MTVEPLVIEFRAVPEELARVRGLLRTWLASTVADPNRAYDILLAVSEACSNSIEHGHRGDGRTIRVQATAGDTIRIAVGDTGTWSTRCADPAAQRGRGLPLMRTLVPDTRITTGADGTTVEFTAPPTN